MEKAKRRDFLHSSASGSGGWCRQVRFARLRRDYLPPVSTSVQAGQQPWFSLSGSQPARFPADPEKSLILCL
jgi:hypothetical protein